MLEGPVDNLVIEVVDVSNTSPGHLCWGHTQQRTHYGNLFRAGKPPFIHSKETLLKEKKILGLLSLFSPLPTSSQFFERSSRLNICAPYRERGGRVVTQVPLLIFQHDTIRQPQNTGSLWRGPQDSREVGYTVLVQITKLV